MSGNQSSTIVFPLPLDLLKPFFEKGLPGVMQKKPDNPGDNPWGGKESE